MSRCLSACLVLIASSIALADPRPNVLFIAVDDLNDWIGPLAGHPQARTPNMDRLADAGAVFTNAHCQSPLCNPSRTSILTGLRPSTTGVYALEPWFRTHAPLRDIVTLPQYFAASGYRTLSTGKVYHDGSPPRPSGGRAPEFDVFGPVGGPALMPPRKFVETPVPHRAVDWGVFPERDDQQADYTVTTWAIDQIKSMPKEKPFFLCVGLRKPHVPCYATQKWFDLYPLDGLRMPPILDNDRDDTPRFSWYLHWKLPEPRLNWLREHHQWEALVRAYLACVSFADSQVGRLLDALRDAHLDDNTIVVLWGDHGWHLGEKGITGKTTLWERSTRVPLLFAGPGVTRRTRCHRPAELLDVYPTLVELCGLPPKAGLDGHSLAPQLKDASAPRAWPAITTHGQNNHTVRTEDWRYIRYADGSEELYDERKDPNEWTNVASDPANAAIKKDLAAMLPRVNTPPVPRSKSRLVAIIDDEVYWEGERIDPTSRPE